MSVLKSVVCLKNLTYRGFSSKKRKAYSVHSLERVKFARPLIGLSPSGTLRCIPTLLSSLEETRRCLPAKYRYQFLYLHPWCGGSPSLIRRFLFTFSKYLMKEVPRFVSKNKSI